MEKVEIKSIRLKNFKGIRNLEFTFKDVTNIIGTNETGKTTVTDAFYWVLFDKDSQGRSDFSIKTIYKKTGEVIPRLEHEVDVQLLKNGKPISFKKCLIENWKKKRGFNQEVYSGNSTKYFWDNVPVKKNEYQQKVDSVITESLFKHLTNPKYFNSQKWTDKRDQLMDLVPSLTDKEFAAKNKYEELLSRISADKTFNHYKLELKDKLKNTKKEVQFLPTRIDECNNQLNHGLEDREYYEGQIHKANARIFEIDDEIENEGSASKNQAGQLNDIHKDISKLRQQKRNYVDGEYDKLTKDINQKAAAKNEKENKFEALQNDLTIKKSFLKNVDEKRSPKLQKEIEDYKSDITKLREDFKTESKKEFEPLQPGNICGHCGQVIEGKHLEKQNEEALQSFDESKTQKLRKINERGQQLTKHLNGANEELKKLLAERAKTDEAIKNNEKDLRVLQEEINKLKSELQNLRDKYKKVEHSVSCISFNSEIKKLEDKREKLEKEKPSESDYKLKLKEEKKAWQKEIESHNANLLLIDNNEKMEIRINELSNQEKEYQQSIADLERDIMQLEEFEKAKMRDLEKRINQRFEYVDFKLFNIQENGGHKETCEALVDGVPYNDVNTAGKINAGIDIINVFSSHYGIIAPVFIDNRESIVNLLRTERQIVNLSVDKNYKELTIK